MDFWIISDDFGWLLTKSGKLVEYEFHGTHKKWTEVRIVLHDTTLSSAEPNGRSNQMISDTYKIEQKVLNIGWVKNTQI